MNFRLSQQMEINGESPLPVNSRWMAPAQGAIKFNCDASLEEGSILEVVFLLQ